MPIQDTRVMRSRVYKLQCPDEIEDKRSWNAKMLKKLSLKSCKNI